MMGPAPGNPRLSQKDAHRILALLDRPTKPNKRLKDAVKTHQRQGIGKTLLRGGAVGGLQAGAFAGVLVHGQAHSQPCIES